MPFKKEIVEALEAGQERARVIARDLVAGFPSIVAVALVGAWARGIVSQVDIDFVVVVRHRRELKRLARYLQEYRSRSSEQLTLFYFTSGHVASKAERWKSRDSLGGPIRLGRVATRTLRRYPTLKKVLIRVLAGWLPLIRLYEFPPQSLQTWMPVYDEDGLLRRLQESQRSLLADELSALEWLLWSPNGFYRLMEGYLSGSVKKEAVREALASYDVNWDEYLRRSMTYYGASESARIRELYTYLMPGRS